MGEQISTNGWWSKGQALDFSGPRVGLLLLLLLWAGFLFGGFFLGKAGTSERERIPTWARMASSFTLVVAAWSWFALARTSDASAFSLLIAVGMTLGFVGDLAMADLLSLEQPAVGGMAAFGLGHVAYIAALFVFGNQQGLNAPAARWGALAAWLGVGLLGWLVVVLPSSQPIALRGAALAYTLLLASTAGFATGLAWQGAAFITLAIGAGLFFLSDMVLAAEMFAGLRFRGLGDVVWLTYGPGQMLIVYAVPFALAVSRR
jgi:hypothetical protein